MFLPTIFTTGCPTLSKTNTIKCQLEYSYICCFTILLMSNFFCNDSEFSSIFQFKFCYYLTLAIVYSCSGLRRPQCSNNFFSETAWPIKAKINNEPLWVGGNKSLFAAFGSHDQDGHRAHIW